MGCWRQAIRCCWPKEASTSPPLGERVEIRLNHLTAIARGGLIRLLAASDAPYLLKTEVNCANSFLITHDAPLVEQRGPQRIAMLEQQFQWSGDRNFCQGFSVFWQLVDTNAPSMHPALVSAPQWQTQMGQGDNLLPLHERRLETCRCRRSRRAARCVAEDFVLADRCEARRALRSKRHGRSGHGRARLPDLPAEPLAACYASRDAATVPRRRRRPVVARDPPGAIQYLNVRSQENRTGCTGSEAV